MATSTIESDWVDIPQSGESDWVDVPQNDGSILSNATQDIKDIGSGLSSIAKFPYKAITQPREALRDVGNVGKAILEAGPQIVRDPTQGNKLRIEPGSIFRRVQDLTTSPIKSFKEHPVNMAIDVASVGLPILRSTRIPRLAGAPTSLFERGISKGLSLLGPDEEAILARMSNPKAIKTAGSVADISNTFPDVANKFKDVIKKLSNEADKTISRSRFISEGALTKDEVLNEVAKARRNLGGIYTQESQSAANALEKIADNFKKIRNTVSQNQIKTIIGDLDNEIPWTKVWKSPETLTASDNALIDIRTGLDSMLKSKNKSYEKLMEPVSKAINTRNEFLKKFNIERVKGKGYAVGDYTINRAANALNENKVASQRLLQNVKDVTGEDLASKIQNAKFKEEFVSPTTKTLDDVLRPKWQKIFGRPIAGATSDIYHGSKKLFNKTMDLMTPREVGYAPAVAVSRGILTEDKAIEYLQKANNDPQKARMMAIADGWIIQ